MKKSTKLFLAILSLCIALLSFSACTFSSKLNLIFKLQNDQTYSVMAKTGNLPKNMEIPDTYKGKSVTIIGDNAFKNRDRVESIEIPASITLIGNYAFSNCVDLKNITVSENNQYYKDIDGNLYTKDGKTLLQYAIGKEETSFTVPDGVEAIGYCAFEYASNLTSIILPNSVKTIGTRAFSYCKNVTEIEIPNSVTEIGKHSFYNCDGLTSVKIGSGVKTIGAEAFYDCDGLTSVVIPNSVTSIETYAFTSCSSLADVEFGSGVKTIGYKAFATCSSLTDVEIPDNVTSIGSDAFYDCDALSSVVIGDGVKTVGTEGFSSCDNLASVVIGNGVETITEKAFNGCVSLTSVVIGNKVKTISNDAFNGCANLTDVVIPDSVEVIGDKSFLNCATMDSLVIGNAVKTIGADAFNGCASLTGVVIPDSVEALGNKSFANCSEINNLVIGSAVKTIGADAFAGCALTKVNYVGTIDHWVEIEFADGEANPVYYTESLFINDELITEVNLTTATKISSYAFYNCTSLTGITISDSVDSISEYAFYNCNGINRAVIGNSVKSIGEGAFENCSGLTNLAIPDSVEKLSAKVFSNCENLESLVIGNGVTSIANDSFAGCNKLQYNVNGNLKYLGNDQFPYSYLIMAENTDIQSCTIYDGVRVICSNAFDGCSAINSVTLPASAISRIPKTSLKTVVITVGEKIDDNAFNNCTTLESIVIPNGIKTIGSNAFNNCISLIEVEIPESVEKIGANAFAVCKNLTSITVDENNEKYKDVDGNLYTKDGKDLIQYVISKKDASFTVPAGVETIKSQAFKGCDSLESVVIPVGVKAIEKESFASCANFNSVYYNGSISQWCGISFNESSANPLSYAKEFYLNNVKFDGALVIAGDVTKINDYAFYGCSIITSLEIPATLKTIGKGAFSNCINLNSVEYTGDLSGWCGMSFGDASANPLAKAKEFYVNGAKIEGAIVIPDEVTALNNHVFAGHTGINSVVIGVGVKTIGEETFKDCSALTTIYYKGTVDAWKTASKGVKLSAAVQYYSETKPTDTNNKYWHYDEDGKIVTYDVTESTSSDVTTDTSCSGSMSSTTCLALVVISMFGILIKKRSN